jgi:DtxR family Mn-dependent transcriptional regulator
MTITEENYIKSILQLSGGPGLLVSTNAIAGVMNTAAASVTDMVKRLTEKGYVEYRKYKGTSLTEKGHKVALQLLRKHRLWETFMVEKLNFSWDEVHQVAEQLEHIDSTQLIDRLDAFLGYPKFDPHGDPIPSASGEMPYYKKVLLPELNEGDHAIITGVKEDSSAFLKYLEQQGLILGAAIQLESIFDYDGSIQLVVGTSRLIMISQKVASNLYVKYIEY